jgi:Protein of unknown function (DUF998)
MVTRRTDAPMEQSTRLLLACGVIGPPLFVIVLLIEGATRPGYSAWRNYGSSLGLGPGGWMQVANFIVCGALCVGFAVGLRRVLRTGKGSTWGPILLGVFGLSLIVAGIFVTDPSLGYPPGTHGSGPQTLHGTIHGVAGLVCFASVAAACFVLARRFVGDPRWKGWTAYSIISGALVAGSFVAATTASVLDEQGTLPGAPTGLLQRIGIVVGWSWIALLAARLLGMARSREA